MLSARVCLRCSCLSVLCAHTICNKPPVVPPLLAASDPLQVQYKHLVPASAAGTAGAAGQPKAPPAKAAVGQQAAAKAGKAKQEAPPAFQYSASQPSCSLRVKKLNSAVVSRWAACTAFASQLVSLRWLCSAAASCCGVDGTEQCTNVQAGGLCSAQRHVWRKQGQALGCPGFSYDHCCWALNLMHLDLALTPFNPALPPVQAEPDASGPVQRRQRLQ